MCSPVISNLAKSAPIWAVPCPGSVCFPEYHLARELTTLTSQVPVQGAVATAVSGGRLGDAQVRVGAEVARLRQVWLSQDEQGLSVFDGINPIAPTAHMGDTQRGVQGPKPWRRLA